jgi:ribA/ribD-fused uncharacterized protein
MKIAGFFNEFRFLSNFYFAKVKFDEVEYESVEHAYQALKAEDRAEHDYVASRPTAKAAKAAAYKIKTFRQDWDEVKLSIMERLVLSKFSNNSDLRNFLILTHPYELEETNTWGDTFWGVCNGEGENHLGKILMRVRERFLDNEKVSH